MEKNESVRSRVSEWIIKNTTLRVVMIGILSLLLLIPLSMVKSIVLERRSAYDSVLAEIGAHWGKEQVLVGPLLVIPFTEKHEATETVTEADGKERTVTRTYLKTFRAVVLPKEVTLTGSIKPEFRTRSIYQSLVYAHKLKLAGSFVDTEKQIRSLSENEQLDSIQWDKSIVIVGLSDPKGISKVSSIALNHQAVELSPGTRVPDVLTPGFHAPIHLPSEGTIPFSMELTVKGSYGFRFAPIGELSEMKISSSWLHPSFYGDLLPAEHNITDKGFEAHWTIPHLVRAYPQTWVLEKSKYDLVGFSAGVRLFEPVTLYTEATRATKYGFLFIVLTFLTLILAELSSKERPGMVQYIVIGVALALFYLLLIAFSEHIGFTLAYAVAASVVVAMNTLYTFAVFKRKRLSLVMMGVLIALYTAMFMILRAEDYALLSGALLLLLAVAATMYFTRHLNAIKE